MPDEFLIFAQTFNLYTTFLFVSFVSAYLFAFFFFCIQQCSHLCGRKGRQIRRLFCHHVSGKKVARFNCPVKYKPQRKRKCNQRRCGPVSCLEIQKRLRVSADGEYQLLIGGRNMTIYCHDMLTTQPREYLTLPAGETQNYAEIYNKRLINLYFLHTFLASSLALPYFFVKNRIF